MNLFRTTGEAFCYYYFQLKNFGIDRGDNVALFNVSMTINNPFDYHGTEHIKKFNVEYAKLEQKYYNHGYFTGLRDTEAVSKYKLWQESTESDGNTWNNYGWHIGKDSQFLEAAEELKFNPTSRRAVVTLFDRKYENYEKSFPCACNVIYDIRNNKLFSTTLMRSNDIYFGFMYDVLYFAKLQNRMSELLGIERGDFIWNIQNFHLYKQNIK